MTGSKSKERKKAVKLADDWASKWVRKLYGECVTCHTRERLTCSHIFSRVAYSTRWNPMNLTCQCAPCNGRAEWDNYELTSWFLKKNGLKAYDDLHFEYSTPHKFTTAEILEIADFFKEHYQLLEDKT